MEYRIHPRTKDKISVIGIGTGPIYEAPEREAVETLSYACEHGVNYVDFATAGSCVTRWYWESPSSRVPIRNGTLPKVSGCPPA